MNNYFITNNKLDCNGCGTCASRCPKKAITMVEDEEGFLYPKIDKSKCINCSLCKLICSNIPTDNTFKIKVFAAKNKVEEDRKNSTSGGMFKILSENIISKKGVVFGAKYSDDLIVKHSYGETIEDCKEFSISKYVRSDLNNSYEMVEKFLNDGRYVLFSGTPCQNYGLKKYLKKDYEKLLLCEIICHSNSSPKVFKLYKENLEKKYNKKIEKYYFRSKNKKTNNKPYILFQDGTIKECQLYNNAFNDMLISRPSCSNCHFCDTNRKADITIGDYWGIEKIFPEFSDNKGISLLCINSEKGMNLFNEIKRKIKYKESSLEDGFKYNHHYNIQEHKNRKDFFKGISNNSINSSNIIKYMKKYTKTPFYKKIITKIKNILYK